MSGEVEIREVDCYCGSKHFITFAKISHRDPSFKDYTHVGFCKDFGDKEAIFMKFNENK